MAEFILTGEYCSYLHHYQNDDGSEITQEQIDKLLEGYNADEHPDPYLSDDKKLLSIFGKRSWQIEKNANSSQ